MVVGGIALIQSGVVDLGELRAWVTRVGANQAWALPILVALDKESAS